MKRFNIVPSLANEYQTVKEFCSSGDYVEYNDPEIQEAFEDKDILDGLKKLSGWCYPNYVFSIGIIIEYVDKCKPIEKFRIIKHNLDQRVYDCKDEEWIGDTEKELVDKVLTIHRNLEDYFG